MGEGEGIRLGLWEARRAQIPGPTKLLPQHSTTAVPTVCVSKEKGSDRPVAGYMGRGEGWARKDNAPQVGYRDFRVLRR